MGVETKKRWRASKSTAREAEGVSAPPVMDYIKRKSGRRQKAQCNSLECTHRTSAAAWPPKRFATGGASPKRVGRESSWAGSMSGSRKKERGTPSGPAAHNCTHGKGHCGADEEVFGRTSDVGRLPSHCTPMPKVLPPTLAHRKHLPSLLSLPLAATPSIADNDNRHPPLSASETGQRSAREQNTRGTFLYLVSSLTTPEHEWMAIRPTPASHHLTTRECVRVRTSRFDWK